MDSLSLPKHRTCLLSSPGCTALTGRKEQDWSKRNRKKT